MKQLYSADHSERKRRVTGCGGSLCFNENVLFKYI